MSLPGWALPAAAAVVTVGLGLFGLYSNIGANAKSAPRPVSATQPVIPVWDPGDTSLATPTQSQPSEPIEMLTDPWASERMEAASKEPFVEGLKESGEVVKADDLHRDTFSDQASHAADSIPSEIKPTLSEHTTTSSQSPAQPSTDQYTDMTPQQAGLQTPPPTLPNDIETSLSPPKDTTVLGDIDDSAREGRDKMKRILIVEDPRALSENLASVLNREPDLEVLGPISSAGECRNFAAGGEGFDISVIDLSLSDDQGIGLIKELRESCPDALVLVLTTGLDPRDQERAIKAGADAVLGRGADLDEIISTIRRLSRS